jgi:hypothetical protein
MLELNILHDDMFDVVIVLTTVRLDATALQAVKLVIAVIEMVDVNVSFRMFLRIEFDDTMLLALTNASARSSLKYIVLLLKSYQTSSLSVGLTIRLYLPLSYGMSSSLFMPYILLSLAI